MGRGPLEVAIRHLLAAAALEPESFAVWGDLAGAYYAMNHCKKPKPAC